MSQFKAFKKIPQFKDAIKTIRLQSQFTGLDDEGRPIYNAEAPLPVVKFTGTVKLHGSNASIRLDRNTGIVTPQKRTSDLGGIAGHFGFVEHVKAHEDFYREKLTEICDRYDISSVNVFGERVGEGVQKKVAISELPKRFVAFEVWDGDNECYLDAKEALRDFRDHSKRCYNIWDYETFEIEVDTRYPELSVEVINKLVEQVEKVCPVSKAMLLIEKPDRYEDREEFLGEGIVFRSEDYSIFFKSKGDKHATGGGKRATVNPIKAGNVKEFIDKTVTVDRLQQCWDEVASTSGGEVQMKQMPDLMRWIFNDIMTEEGDALEYNDLSKKDVSGAIANTARPWFIAKINSF
jgi:hypothetical protein